MQGKDVEIPSPPTSPAPTDADRDERESERQSAAFQRAAIKELEERKKAAARMKSKSKMEGIGEFIGILLRGLTPLIWLGTALWAVWLLSGNHPHYLH